MSTDRRRPARRPARRALILTLNGLLLAGVGAWAIFLRPQSLGGPAAYVLVTGDSMLPSISDGDLAVLVAQPAYAVGDVVAYRLPDDDPGARRQVIHRIVGMAAESDAYVMRGDNTSFTDVWRPRNEEIVGRLTYLVPGVGQVVTNLRRPIVLSTFVTLVVLWMFYVRPQPKPAISRAAQPYFRYSRADLRFRNLPHPFLPVQASLSTTTSPRDSTTSEPPTTSRPS